MSEPLTSQVAHIGAVIERVLDEMREKNLEFGPLGLPLVVYGPADDAADASAPSIYWAPTKERFGPPMRLGAAASPGPLHTRTIPVSFLLFGGVDAEGTYSDDEAPYHDCDLTETLLSKLVNCFQRHVSQQSYELEDVTWFNSGRTGIGMACELVVGLKLPLIREDNPTVTVTAVKANAEIVKP
jgi:hypothetical protein